MTATVTALSAVTGFVRDRAADLDLGRTDIRADIGEIGGSGLLSAGLGDSDIREITLRKSAVSAVSTGSSVAVCARHRAGFDPGYADPAPRSPAAASMIRWPG